MDGQPASNITRYLLRNFRFPAAVVVCFCASLFAIHRYRRVFSQPRMQVQGALWESTREDEVNRLPPEMARLVPDGYAVQGMYQGDLDHNGRDDYAMVASHQNEDSLSGASDRPVPRALLLIVSRPDGSFAVAARSDRAVYCTRCGGIMGDPLEEISVDSGRFTIQQYGGAAWRWSRTTEFSYDQDRQDWLLAFDSTEHFAIAQPDDATRHSARPVGTEAVRFKDFDVYQTTGI
ncbi:MAG: hypothetical protein IPN71_05130 [Fibrobacteres bacterium]|nr:hypothetical protein [Fibrobacterota bacterium]